MLKQTLAATAALAITASLAFAQSSTSGTTTTTTTTPNAMTTTTPGATTTTSGKTSVSTTTTGSLTSSSYLTTVDSKAWLGSKLIGTPVYTSSTNERIGEVNNIIIDPTGQVSALVIGAGGFLGVGERDIAVKFTAFKATKDDDNEAKLTLDVTKDTLKNAPKVDLSTNSNS